jgi:hypothetical protein
MSTAQPNTQPWRAVKARRSYQDEPHSARTQHRHVQHRVQLTDRDLDLLRFVAAHRFVQARHAHEWVGANRSIAYRLLSRLVDAGLLRYERIFHAQPGIFLITNGGLAVIDSPLPKPQIDLRIYRHETLVVTAWLAAHRGAFGPVEGLATEREIRHHDQADIAGELLGVRIGGTDRAGRPRLHSPDLLVQTTGGSLTAVELELTAKGRRRLEEIVISYQLDDRIGQVIYLTDQRNVAAIVTEIADQLAPQKVRVLQVDQLGSTTAVTNAVTSGRSN